MEPLKNLPIGVQNFERLRQDGFFYVDKTALVYKLATEGRYYFLSRPRRFGKSLLLSTLHAYFAGQKDLFEGLAIEQLEKKWTVHPVLHLDLNVGEYQKENGLRDMLSYHLTEWEKQYGINECGHSLGDRFAGVIRHACEKVGQRVVVLVDEYDKPVLLNIDNKELQDAHRATLREFYSALKREEKRIRFVMLTGVTKYGKMESFSDLDKLEDISMDPAYAPVCGFTDEEIDSVFAPYVQRMADSMGRDLGKVRKELSLRYNGYHFCADSPGIYNGFGMLLVFANKHFRDYWCQTGSPSILLERLLECDYNVERLSMAPADADTLNCMDPLTPDPIPMIYQSGYLTIRSYDPLTRMYTLGFPNREVEESFMHSLLRNYTSEFTAVTGSLTMYLVKGLEAGQTDDFLKRLSRLFADTPYESVKNFENHCQNVLFIVTRQMGFYVKAEYHTSEGRIDLLLQTADYTYVMEFKLDGTAEEALRQINDKRYAQPFECDSSRKLVKVGVNFSSATRGIERWVVE